MPRKPVLTPDQMDDLCASYIAGMTQVELAKKFSISQAVVSKYLRINEVKTRKGTGGRKNYREFCKRGHKLADPNLYYKRNTTTREITGRMCKACANASNNDYYATVRKHKIARAKMSVATGRI